MKKRYFLLILLLFCLCFAIFSNNTIKADGNSNLEQHNFINSIEDPEVRIIFRYRHIELKNWEEIAKLVFMSRASVCRKHQEYLNKCL